METAYYHVNDPLENLRLRVTVRETSRVATGTTTNKKTAPYSFDKEVVWQEKIVGPRDFVKRLSKKENNVKDNELKPVMLYTYIDKDHFWTENLPNVVDRKQEESYLGAAMFSQSSDEAATTTKAREIKVQKRITREKPFKSMHICLATDVDVDALQSKNMFGTAVSSKQVAAHLTEHILCSIRLYGDGLLEVYPNFSSPTSESGGAVSLGVGGAFERASLSAFLDDGTVQNAINKGFRLMTHRVLSKGGVEYEYCIHNVNDLMSPMDIDEILLRRREIDMKAALQNRSSADAANWRQDPPSKGYHKTVTMYAEIVSGKDFYGRQLFVNYQIQLPQGWDLRTGNLSDGVAEKDVAEAIATAQTSVLGGSDTEIEGGQGQVAAADLALDGYADGALARGMLHGTTHTAIAADLRLSTSRERPSRLPPYTPFAHPSQGTRFLLGLSFFMITVVSVILGESIPFWIVPALGIVFILGNGYPNGTVQLVLSESKHSVSKGSAAGVTKGKKTTYRGMDSSVRRRETGTLMYPAVAHFNHLINTSFDVRDIDIALQTAALNLGAGSKAPTLHFQVYSVGWMDRHVLEGYGYMVLPDEPGTIDVDIKTWRPQGDIQSKMAEFFLGSAARLKDPMFAEVPNKKASAINRFGVLTESSGSVRLRCHTILTDARLARVLDAQPVEVTKAMNRSRTVEEILNNFRSAGQLGSRRSASSGVGRTLVSSSLEGGIADHAQSSAQRDSRVDAIVSQVRAKKAAASSSSSSSSSIPPRPSRLSASLGNSGNLGTSESASLLGRSEDRDRDRGQQPLRLQSGTPRATSRQRNRYQSPIKEGDDEAEEESEVPLLRK